jgi:hypothetical protein
MNQLIELHDSKIGGIFSSGSTMVVAFTSAYIHRSDGIPSIDPGTGWIQQAEFVIRTAEKRTHPALGPADVTDGCLTLGDRILDNMIPIPLDFDGEVVLTLELCDPTSARFERILRGVGAKLTLLGDAQYVERFPGAAQGSSGRAT